HIGKSEKLPGFQRRAIYFNIYLHVHSRLRLDNLEQYRRARPYDASGPAGGYLEPSFGLWSTEARRGIGCRIGERCLAGHHFGQQTAGRGTERQPVMLVPEIE